MTNMSIQPLWLTYFIEILLVLEFQLTKNYFGMFCYKAHFRPQISSNDKTYNVPHIWNYFETRHSKGEHDGADAWIKTTLRREEMRFNRNPHVKDVESIVQWCSPTMSDRTSVVGRPVKNIWHVLDIHRSRSYSCSTVQGTCGFHLVWSSNNPLFETLDPKNCLLLQPL